MSGMPSARSMSCLACGRAVDQLHREEYGSPEVECFPCRHTDGVRLHGDWPYGEPAVLVRNPGANTHATILQSSRDLAHYGLLRIEEGEDPGWRPPEVYECGLSSWYLPPRYAEVDGVTVEVRSSALTLEQARSLGFDIIEPDANAPNTHPPASS